MESFFSRIKNIASELKTFKRFVVVGKGAGTLSVRESSLQDAFIINLNDSERLIQGHVTLYHADWVTESLQHEGWRNRYYFTPEHIAALLPETAIHIPVSYRGDNNEGIEHISATFHESHFILSDFLLFSAIKLAYLLMQEAKMDYPVYLIGFDFEHHEEQAMSDLSGHDQEYKKVVLRTQKDNFRYIKKFLIEDIGMKLYHVGRSELSDMSLEAFNALAPNSSFVEKENIARPSFQKKALHYNNKEAYDLLLKKCAEENYTLVVAELTNNHIGDAARLRQMIRCAKQSGADMIKVQKRDVDTFYSEQELKSYYPSPFGTTLEDYRKGVELNEALMEVLIQECEAQQIVWFASILDYPSLKFIEEYDVPLIKLPSTISNHKNFLKKVAEEYPGDLVISTGFTDAEYEDFVIETFTGKRSVFLLQCTSSYPAPPEACQIAVVRHYEELRSLKNVPGLFSGYSSHDVGSLGCMMAIAAGARMVEKHVKYGNLDWIHFDGVALDLNTEEFDVFVKDVRKAQRMCGSKRKKIHETEHHKYTPNANHN